MEVVVGVRGRGRGKRGVCSFFKGGVSGMGEVWYAAEDIPRSFFCFVVSFGGVAWGL